MRKIPEIQLGDVFFGSNIGYEDPQALWSNVQLAHTMPHQVPIPGQHFWQGWTILRVDIHKTGLLLVAPILFKDLGEYRHLASVDMISALAFEVETAYDKAVILAGRTFFRTPKDFGGRIASSQRRVHPEHARQLARYNAMMARGKFTLADIKEEPKFLGLIFENN